MASEVLSSIKLALAWNTVVHLYTDGTMRMRNIHFVHLHIVHQVWGETHPHSFILRRTKLCKTFIVTGIFRTNVVSHSLRKQSSLYKRCELNRSQKSTYRMLFHTFISYCPFKKDFVLLYDNKRFVSCTVVVPKSRLHSVPTCNISFAQCLGATSVVCRRKMRFKHFFFDECSGDFSLYESWVSAVRRCWIWKYGLY